MITTMDLTDALQRQAIAAQQRVSQQVRTKGGSELLFCQVVYHLTAVVVHCVGWCANRVRWNAAQRESKPGHWKVSHAHYPSHHENCECRNAELDLCSYRYRLRRTAWMG